MRDTPGGVPFYVNFCIEVKSGNAGTLKSLQQFVTEKMPVKLTTTPQRYNFYTMHFEFDSQKSLSNLTKHGINFDVVQTLWNDPDLLEIPAKVSDEPRYLVVGKIDGKHWAAVITYRDKAIRIISVRRSRSEEIALYES